MPFEIEMLSVKAADAIIIRYFDEVNNEVVILIDAGRKEHGGRVVQHIDRFTKGSIDLAICTHPDEDHIGGFFEVVDKVPIDEFWIHDPTRHVNKIEKLTEAIDGSRLYKGGLQTLNETLKDSLNLLELIDSKRTIRRDREPFEGTEYEKAPLKIIGPTKPTYQQLLSKYRDVSVLLGREKDMGFAEKIILESKLGDVLKKYNDGSKENNSSAITLFTPANRKYLFTSDTKSKFIREASEKYDLIELDWMQVPHHGSIYNIDEDVIKILKPKVAYVSGDGSDHYPNEKVVELLKSYDCNVYSTAKNNLLHRRGTSKRPGYGKATPL
ncbi:MBL fold metallo-hydrolase [Flavisolibacter sp. BT320]|nr:MBL fold metallo-hydrolase [Flavisolibacter longurius]